MVKIQIDDEVWSLYARSWVVMGVESNIDLVKMLERYLIDSSIEVLRDAEQGAFNDEQG